MAAKKTNYLAATNRFFASEGVKAMIPYVMIGIAGYVVYRKFFAGGNVQNNPQQQQNQMDQVPVQTNLLNHAAAYYTAVADTQFSNLNEWHVPFTDYNEEIFTSLSGLNSEELKQVAKAFGSRCSSISLFPGSSQCVDGYQTLPAWYMDRLPTSQLKRMRVLWHATGLL